jgi:hypothetical protein
LNRANFLILIAVFFSTFVFSLDTAFSGVSPEHKEAAQKRQAEIARQMFCSEKAVKKRLWKQLRRLNKRSRNSLQPSSRGEQFAASLSWS